MNSGEHLIGRWISILFRCGQGFANKRFEKFNFGSGQYIFLLNLYRKDGISQEEISEHLKIDKATTAKALKRLESDGYITRTVDEFDKRAYKVYITQKALDIKKEFMDTVRDWNNILASGLTNDEKEIVLKILKKMSENASKHLEESKEVVENEHNTSR